MKTEVGIGTSRYTVRILSNDGRYPRRPIMLDSWAVLMPDTDMVWTAVHTPIYDRDEQSEISWLFPDEIRFYAAVSLAEAVPYMEGRPLLYGRSMGQRLELPADVGPDILISEARRVAQDLNRAPSPEAARSSLAPQWRASPDLIDKDYAAEVRRIAEAIEPEHLLYRGLYKFLVASDLRRFHYHLEESALAAFVSREAALELLRRKMQMREGGRPKREDVIERIRTTFPTGEAFCDVLQSDWEARVMMVHPVSDYGERWSPEVHADECYESLYTVSVLYRYLLLDEVWDPDHHEST